MGPGVLERTMRGGRLVASWNGDAEAAPDKEGVDERGKGGVAVETIVSNLI